MTRIVVSLAAVVLWFSVSVAQNAEPASPQTPGAAQASSGSGAQASAEAERSSLGLSEGSTVRVSLTKPLDAKKNKPGDEVVAKTAQPLKSNGQTTIPRGTKILGHVTEAQARMKGQAESKLGLAFDAVVLKSGNRIPLSASIQAIAQPQSVAAAPSDDEEPTMPSAPDASGRSMGEGRSAPGEGGLAGRTASTVGNTTSTVANTAGQATGQAANISRAGQLSADSRGVIGLKSLSLNTEVAASQGSVISSQQQNVHLDSGTEMLLRVGAK